MANDNASENKRQDFEEIDIDIVEKQLQDQLSDQLSDFSPLLLLSKFVFNIRSQYFLVTTLLYLKASIVWSLSFIG